MKWFTREWAKGQLSEDESKSVTASYLDHLNSILMHLTEGIDDALITGVNIHDGHVKNWRQDGDSIELDLVSGDNQSGYQRILMVFREAHLVTPASLDELNFGNPRTELLYDEFDVAGEGLFEYRVLVWPTGELAVRFRSNSVRIAEARASDR